MTDVNAEQEPITDETTVTIDVGRWAAVPLALVEDTSLTDRAVRVWALLAARWANRAGEAWPSRQTIADALGCSTDTVDRAIRQLEHAGWLRVIRTRRPDRTSAPNRYRLHTVPRETGAAPVPREGRRSAEDRAADSRTGGRTDAAGTRTIEPEPEEPRSAAEATLLASAVAHDIVTAFYDHLKATTGHPPLWSFPGTVQIVKRALQADWPAVVVKRALLDVHQHGRTITGTTLDDAMRRLSADGRPARPTDVSRGPAEGVADSRPATWDVDVLSEMFDTTTEGDTTAP